MGFVLFCFSCIFCQSNGKLEVCVAVFGWFCGDLAGCVPFGSCFSLFEHFMVNFLSSENYWKSLHSVGGFEDLSY